MIRREWVFFSAAIAVMAIAGFAFWAIVMASPFTFRSDCRQIEAHAWICDEPSVSRPVPVPSLQ